MKYQISNAHTAGITCVAVIQNSGIIITGSLDTFIKSWNATDGSEISVFYGHEESVNSLFIMLDDTILSGGGDATVRTWLGSCNSGGGYCNKNSNSPITCDGGFYCPSNYTTPISCGTGRFCPKVSISLSNE